MRPPVHFGVKDNQGGRSMTTCSPRLGSRVCAHSRGPPRNRCRRDPSGLAGRPARHVLGGPDSRRAHAGPVAAGPEGRPVGRKAGGARRVNGIRLQRARAAVTAEDLPSIRGIPRIPWGTPAKTDIRRSPIHASVTGERPFAPGGGKFTWCVPGRRLVQRLRSAHRKQHQTAEGPRSRSRRS